MTSIGCPADLCTHCLEFVKDLCASTTGVNAEIYWTIPKPSECDLCQYVRQNLHESDLKSSEVSNGKVYLKVMLKESGMQSEKQLLRLCFMNTPSRYKNINLAFWADSKSPASRRFATSSPILGPHVMQVCKAITRWMTECCSLHTTCSSTLEHKLPSRVLKIYGDLETPYVRLVGTSHTDHARYWALSHCWGSIEKQPLRTTRENYQTHLAGIPFEQLPKTFQDAIRLARGASTKYLWIDSLCIIQDDNEDWKKEAANMAGIYKNAALVVSAAYANDSTEGLCIDERGQQTTISVPYIIDDTMHGTFNIALQPKLNYISAGKLDSRAWAFQERHLAGRIVSFTKPGLWWNCQIVEMWEGVVQSYTTSRNIPWLWLLTYYSRKELTYAGDHLYALRGITEDMKQTRSDRYFQDYGIWEEDLADQLLWVGETENFNHEGVQLPRHRLVHIPTWSWAAMTGRKTWITKVFDDSSFKALDETSPHLAINTVNGGVETWDLFASYLHYFGPEAFACSNFNNVYVGVAGYDKTPALGLATYDDQPPAQARCFVLCAQSRERDQSFHGDHLERLHKAIAQRGSMPARDVERGLSLISNVVEMVNSSKVIYWCLLLEPLGEAKYKRVGVAILYPHALDVLGAEKTTFTIV